MCIPVSWVDDTSAVARSMPGMRRLISVDFPTPEFPEKRVTLPSSRERIPSMPSPVFADTAQTL